MKFLACALFAASVISASHTHLEHQDAAPMPRFKKYFTLVLENIDLSDAMNDSFLKELATQGRLLTNMHGMVHPSQPNYIEMIAGTNFGKLTDDDIELSGPTVPDLLEAKGLTWKSYQENFPGDCNATHGTIDHLYMRKHNPFMSFASIREHPQRCANIVDGNQFLTDLAKGDLPNYIFYTPNQVHDGHSLPPYSNSARERLGDSTLWLSDFLPKLLVNPHLADTLFVITFDESDVTGDEESKAKGSDKPGSVIGKTNLIYTVLLGAGVQGGSIDNTRYDHHSGIALLEREWDLGSLGTGDVVATPFKLTDDDVVAIPPCTTTAANPYTQKTPIDSYIQPTPAYYQTQPYVPPVVQSTRSVGIYQSSAVYSSAASLIVIALGFMNL